MHLSDARHVAGLDALDVDVLLCALLGRDRAWLLAHGDAPLTPAQEHLWPLWCARRRAGEPVAYITRERWFFGRPFVVDPRVLVPRPATEALVDLALRTLDAPHPLTERVDGDVVVLSRLRSFSPVRDVVDLGTGSGCVAITLAAERADLSVLAVDVSVAALDVAAVNVERLGVAHRVRLQASDGLRSVAPLLLRPFLFVSNPPYIPDDHALARDVHAFEPPLALRGGPGHGAALLLRLVAEAWAHPRCVGVVLECRADQVPFLDAQLQAS